MILRRLSPLVLAVLAAACAPSSEEDTKPSGEDAITSNDGTALEFQFEASVVTEADTPARQAIVAQLQYAQGILTTAERANGQVGLVELSNVKETEGGATKTVSYKASLPVLFPKRTATPVPTSYDLAFPKDATNLMAFNRKYDAKCGNNEYGVETFWHDFNPKAATCQLEDGDVVRATATVRPHPKTTTNKYPEYSEIWKDDALDIVAVFGIISSNTPSDEGARERESVIRRISASLTDAKRVDNTPGRSAISDSTVTGTIMVGGKKRNVKLDAILVEEVAATGADFDERFGAATEKADFVVYSGHSGLGKNINALAKKSRVTKGKYQLSYLNGCQTFAYLGDALHQKKIAANPEDTAGTKYLDIVANALPSYGDDGDTIITLYDAMTKYTSGPKTYNQLLQDFSSRHLVAVFGEDDNVFTP